MVLLMEIFEGITVCYLSQLLKFVIKNKTACPIAKISLNQPVPCFFSAPGIPGVRESGK
jgi:hypothetical protein